MDRSTGSSIFATPTFASASSLFGSSTTASKPFCSGASFGLGSSASLSETNYISCSRGTTSIFGATSNYMAPSTGFSISASSAPSTGCAFGAALNNTPILFGSTQGTSTGSMFSFTSAAANTPSLTSLSQPQPLFGNPNPAFAFGSSSSTNDQMNMAEDPMDEDTMHASTPSVPKFGQAPISSSSNGFLFGSSAPSGVNPFQFGGQQNPTTLHNSSLHAPTPSVPKFGQAPISSSSNGFLFGSSAPSGVNPFQFGGQQNPTTLQNSSLAPSGANLLFGNQPTSAARSERTVKVKRSIRKK